ncbi:MAG: hypothetical protein O7A04_09795 [Acidobacteria bacterium]|nr:hypothetical protein [Acidobacteriota bacterium]
MKLAFACRKLSSVGRSIGQPALISLLIAAASPALAAGGVCEGYPSSRTITALGGSRSFSSESADTLADLQRLAAELAPDLRYSLDTQGLGHLATPLFAAIASGEGVSERALVGGEKFDWMTWRKRGEPQITQDLCFAAKKGYDTWQIDLAVEEKNEACDAIRKTRYTFLAPKACINLALVAVATEDIALPPVPAPVCEITAERSCEGSGEVTVRRAGQVAVRLGSKIIIPADSADAVWVGELGDPYSSVIVTASGETVDQCGRVQNCSQSVEVPACVRPSCAIAPIPDKVKAGQPIPIAVSGQWAGGDIKIVVRDSKGNVIIETPPPFPTSVTIDRAGDYTISGKATNGLGDSAVCETPVTVKRRCTVRGLLGKLSGGGKTHRLGFDTPLGTETDRTEFHLDSGQLVGGEAECFLTPAIGLAAGLLLGDIEGVFMRDHREDWETDREDFGLLIVSAGPNFHFTPKSSVDLYAGPFVALVQFDDATFSALGDTQRIELDDQVKLGAQVGIAIPLGQNRWHFQAGVRYLDLSADSNDLNGFDIDISPTIFTIGLGYDF